MGSRLLIPVIMCGGAGTRLWPVSRESMPKQFVPLVEARSTFQQVLGRIRDATMFDRPIVITNSDFRFIVAEQMRECAIEGDIVLEPMRRDSAMAVGVAAVLAGARDPAAIVIVLAADHVVRDPDAFARACREAMAAAADGRIVTFGIPPTFPATNYGYIRPGAKLDGGSAFAVDAFVEKPDAATAGRYIADRYLWNSGNFVFRADVMLGEIARFEPDIAEGRQGRRRRHDQGSRFPAPAGRSVRAGAEKIHRLCGHGTHRARRRGAARLRLVGYRQLERGLGRARPRRRRQCRDRLRRLSRQPQQPRPFRRGDPHRGGRRGQSRRGGDAGRGAGDVARQGRAGQRPRRAAQGAEPRTGGDAFAGLPAVGLLPGRRRRRALSGQAHRREAERHAVAAKALPPFGTLGRGARGGRSHHRIGHPHHP